MYGSLSSGPNTEPSGTQQSPTSRNIRIKGRENHIIFTTWHFIHLFFEIECLIPHPWHAFFQRRFPQWQSQRPDRTKEVSCPTNRKQTVGLYWWRWRSPRYPSLALLWFRSLSRCRDGQWWTPAPISPISPPFLSILCCKRCASGQVVDMQVLRCVSTPAVVADVFFRVNATVRLSGSTTNPQETIERWVRLSRRHLSAPPSPDADVKS